MTQLSRLILNYRSRNVRRDLADCHQLHRTIMTAFGQVGGDAARAALGVLYRVEQDARTGRVLVLVQSAARPEWSRLPADYLAGDGAIENPAVKPVDEQFARLADGMTLRFRLDANPTKKLKVSTGPDGQPRNGKRVELRNDKDRLDWLQRKAVDGGFALIAVQSDAKVSATQAIAGNKLTGRRLEAAGGNGAAGRRVITIAPVRYDGLLRITDAGRFRETLRAGIGPGKSYGMGLLSIGPASREAG